MSLFEKYAEKTEQLLQNTNMCKYTVYSLGRRRNEGIFVYQDLDKNIFKV